MAARMRVIRPRTSSTILVMATGAAWYKRYKRYKRNTRETPKPIAPMQMTGSGRRYV